MKKFFAFTLAEVLVTLGIIGVVSALTIPSLMQANQKRVFVVQLQKTYSELSQALSNLIEDKHATNIYETKMFRNYTCINSFFSTYLKTSKISCNPGYSGYFNYSYDDINGNTVLYASSSEYTGSYNSGYSTCAVLKDGATVCIRPYYNYNAYITVDTNGPAGPNIVGRDFFQMYVNNDGSIGSSCSSYSTSSPRCMFGYVMNNNWQMNY